MTVSKRAQQACAWSGPAMAVVLGIGLLIAGFIPPPSPDAGAQEIAEFYRSDRDAIRTGLVIAAFGSALLAPFCAVLCVQMRRMEGVRPVFAYSQLALGTLAVLEFIYPFLMMLAVTFRADRDPELIQAMSDVAWILFLGVVSTFVLQLIILGIAILGDRGAVPVFPRWVGYFNVWLGLLFAPGGCLVFFKTGPFAWDGFYVWWVPFVAFGLWFGVNTWYLLRAIQDDPYTPAGTPTDLRHDLEILRAEVETLRAQRSEIGSNGHFAADVAR